MRLFVFMLLCLCLSGCVTRYHSEIEQARAQQAQAQAAIIQAQEQAKMYETLADAAKPDYTPLLILAVLALGAVLMVVRWHMITVSHVAAGQTVRQDDMRLLPGAPGFYPALRQIARKEGGRVEVQGDSYYLIVDGERVKVKSLPGG